MCERYLQRFSLQFYFSSTFPLRVAKVYYVDKIIFLITFKVYYFIDFPTITLLIATPLVAKKCEIQSMFVLLWESGFLASEQRLAALLTEVYSGKTCRR